MRKIKLTSEKLELGFCTLYRIEAIEAIPARGIKVGDKGGFVQSIAQVSGNARVSGNAWVSGNAQVSGDARVYGNARVYGDANIDCAAAILLISIGGYYTFTMTRKMIFVGCKTIERKLWKKFTKKQALEWGCPKELYSPLKEIILAAAKIVKEKP